MHVHVQEGLAGHRLQSYVQSSFFSNCPIISAGSLLIFALSVPYLADLASRKIVDI